MAEIKLSIIVSGLSRLFGDDLHALLEMAKVADAVGIDQIVLPDHLAIGPRTDRYPYGEFPMQADEPWLEPLTTLAAIAGATSRIRLGTGILIAPLRPALLLAKTAATLDALSAGRLDLGVGTGWQREEFEGAGVPFAGRGARMEDTIRACRALWSEAPASFSSPTVSFEDLWCLPRPVQPGGIPIWFGVGLNPRNVARIVELGAGWMPVAARHEELVAGARLLREACQAAGRDPATLGVRGAVAPKRGADKRLDLARSLEVALPSLEEAGATTASLALAAFVRSADDIRPFLEELAKLRDA
jgi:probable F420-dependent oxidoreductase